MAARAREPGHGGWRAALLAVGLLGGGALRAGPPAEPPTKAEAAVRALAAAEDQLLTLLAQEHALLVEYGPDHPPLRALRARMDLARGAISALRARTAQPPKEPPPAVVQAGGAGEPVRQELAPPPKLQPVAEAPQLLPVPGPVVQADVRKAGEPGTAAGSAPPGDLRGPTPPARLEPQSPPTIQVTLPAAPAPAMSHDVWLLAGACLGGFLAQAVALCWVLRRLQIGAGQTVRVEMAAPPAPPPPPPLPPPTLPPRMRPAPADEDGDGLVDQREAAERRQAEGMALQLFQDNLQLRQQWGVGTGG